MKNRTSLLVGLVLGLALALAISNVRAGGADIPIICPDGATVGTVTNPALASKLCPDCAQHGADCSPKLRAMPGSCTKHHGIVICVDDDPTWPEQVDTFQPYNPTDATGGGFVPQRDYATARTAPVSAESTPLTSSLVTSLTTSTITPAPPAPVGP
jgi:hypothetical protein